MSGPVVEYGSWFLHRWRRLLVALTAAFTLPGVVLNVIRPSRPVIGPDAALFQYLGWYVTRGGLPYRHVWDSKPPLTHEFATLLGVLSFGDVFLLHLLSMVTMVAALGVIVLAVGQLVHDVTGDRLAATISGCAIFTYPTFYTLPVHGFRPKFLVIVFGLVSLLLLVRDRLVPSGVPAAMAAGFWQGGIAFPIVVVARVALEREWGTLGKTLAGMGGVAIASVLPFVLAGVANELFTQVVLSPFVASEPLRPMWRVLTGLDYLGVATPVVLVGTAGILLSGPYYRAWWIPGGASLFALQVFLLDLDGPPDLLPGFVFVAIGVGLVADRLSSRQSFGLLCAIGAVVVAVLLLGQPFADVATPAVSKLDVGSVEWHYWHKHPPSGCHLRRSGAEKAFVAELGHSLDERVCGPYDIGEILRAIR